ncbi:uncharacterized protein [Centruroides vittatus]|uniref:uncharacterized protein n=1 Tax=Centruroides vittatus TaxID=120091 RepID=UPI00350FFA37
MAPQSESEMNEMKGKPYRELIGGLLYLANSTRPDLAFAASMLSRFCSNPGIVHWKMAKRVLRYIQATVNYGLHYEKCDQKLCAYVDSDWAGDIDDRKSSSGNMIILANGPVSWQSRKQKSVALSTMEAEYMALSDVTKEVIHMRRMLREMQFESCQYANDNLLRQSKRNSTEQKYHSS